MKIILHSWLLLVSLSTTLAANDPELPLCPTNLQYFPQKLPMHCRLPRNADPRSFPDLPQYPTLPPLPESYFQRQSSDKQPPPIPINIPPFPGMPGSMPMPGHMGGPMGPMGGPMLGPMPGMPGAMPMPMPMVGGPPHKLPVIVMPFYSQDHSFKKPQPQKPRKHREKKRKPHKKKKKYDSDHESSSCEDSESESGGRSSSSEHGFWKGRRKARRKMIRRSNKQHGMRRTDTRNKRKDLLTPILQYVTKDGYVIFEKTISKSEAKDWLKPLTEMTDVKNAEKPEEKRQEDFLFNPKSAEEFFKIDEEDQRKKAMEMKEAAEIEVTTRQGKRQHRPLKFNALTNKSNES